MRIWSLRLEYNDFNLLKLHKPNNRFSKIKNCPPSTCVQNALPLHKCKEHNFFPKDENGLKGASSAYEVFLLFSKNIT